MLRLPKFQVALPESVADAVALLSAHEGEAMIVAGGTDLLPNLKHRLFEPKLLVSLERVAGLGAIQREADGTLRIGAMARLDQLAAHADVIAHAPALAQAAGVVSGPQLRRMGTAGGNVMLDTRCRYYNQTYFWRKSLGFCLKKDGTVCHVVAGGRMCVAAASNDTAPALMTLGARLIFEGMSGRRELLVDDLWKSDGVWNKHAAPSELLTEIRIPPQAAGHRGAYGKLRNRAAIDFPELGVATRVDVERGSVRDADVVIVALAARPVRVKGAADTLRGAKPGERSFTEATARLAEHAFKQCHPMPNVPGDEDYRREMVPVFVRRTLKAAVS